MMHLPPVGHGRTGGTCFLPLGERIMSATSDFYLARAAECARDAAQSPLDNVRERFLRAEAAWRVMANRLTQAEDHRAARAAAAEAE
jgi:hypothetical protein